jgi:hypothetical protein
MASCFHPTPCEMNVKRWSKPTAEKTKTKEKLKNPQQPNTRAPESQEGLKPLTEWDNVNTALCLAAGGGLGVRPPRRLWWLAGDSHLGSALLSRCLKAARRQTAGAAVSVSRDLAPSSIYTGASSPSLFSSLLSALWAVGHTQASAEVASSIAASASHVRIFQWGLSLQRLATYSAVAGAFANATAALLTSTERGISRRLG